MNLFDNKRECVRDLGEDMVEQALRLLDAVDSDNLEVRENSLIVLSFEVFFWCAGWDEGTLGKSVWHISLQTAAAESVENLKLSRP